MHAGGKTQICNLFTAALAVLTILFLVPVVSSLADASLAALVIVVMLEVEVWMQLKNLLTDRLMTIGKYLKTLFYGVLFLCAAYWGFEGTFLDFWDAFLWLVAFIFIEMNIFQWHEETEEAQVDQSSGNSG